MCLPAQRPVFIADPKKDGFVHVVNIDFEWYPGFSIKQKQRSIQSLHKNFNQKYKSMDVLEISSKSESETGISLSAFNLMMQIENQTECSVEVAFQSSKMEVHTWIYFNGLPEKRRRIYD